MKKIFLSIVFGMGFSFSSQADELPLSFWIELDKQVHPAFSFGGLSFKIKKTRPKRILKRRRLASLKKQRRLKFR